MKTRSPYLNGKQASKLLAILTVDSSAMRNRDSSLVLLLFRAWRYFISNFISMVVYYISLPGDIAIRRVFWLISSLVGWFEVNKVATICAWRRWRSTTAFLFYLLKTEIIPKST